MADFRQVIGYRAADDVTTPFASRVATFDDSLTDFQSDICTAVV